MSPLRRARRVLVAALLGAACLSAWSDDAAIRRNFAARNPGVPPIDEITKTPIPGLYELRIGMEIVYTDAQADYLIFPSNAGDDGHIIDSRDHKDLTQARLDRLAGLEFGKLPFKDAIAFKQGNGSRRLVVFEDPNCHYCKEVEHSLVQLKDVTIYTFLIPILGADSVSKARDIWCAKDNSHVWRDWMLAGIEPRREMGHCDTSVLQRNVALAGRFHVDGTPALIFEDGSRFSGAVDLDRLTKKLDAASAAAAAARRKG